MAEEKAGSPGKSARPGESLSRTIGRWTWIICLSFIAFWPMRACVDENFGRDSRGRSYGYGRRSDLQEIGKAIAAYEFSHNDELPPTLWALYPAYIDTPRTLISPGDARPQESGAWLNRYIYLYEGGRSMRDLPPDAPIVLYPFETEDGKLLCSVLFDAGYVKTYYSQTEFLQAWQDWSARQEPGHQ